MAEQWERTVQCDDATGRQRSLKVFPSEDNRVALQSPPGELVILGPASVRQLKVALDELAIELFRRSAES